MVKLRLGRQNSTDSTVFVDKYPVKRDVYQRKPYVLPSGALVVPIGRKSIQCESGLHKWTTVIEHSIPIMKCHLCGYRMPKPILEKTMTKKELISTVQKDMDKGKPQLSPIKPNGKAKTPDELLKDKEALIVRLFEEKQRNYKFDHGIGKYVYTGPRK